MKVNILNERLSDVFRQLKSLRAETLTAGTKNILSKIIVVMKSHVVDYENSLLEMIIKHGGVKTQDGGYLDPIKITPEFLHEKKELDQTEIKDIEVPPVDFNKILVDIIGSERDLKGDYDFVELSQFFENYK